MTPKAAVLAVLTAALLLGGCGDEKEPTGPSGVLLPIPLTDLEKNLYGRWQGGLYPGGVNEAPAAHAAEGLRRARLIQPRDVNGAPSSAGRIVFLSVGLSLTSQEFCGADRYSNCEEWSFAAIAAAAPEVSSRVTFVNGARAGTRPQDWQSASSPEYDRIRSQGLAPLGLSEQQVQVIWLKLVNPQPGVALPFAGADAYQLTNGLAEVARALHQRYPNLQQVYVSSRSYGGFAVTNFNPEPFAYQTGFSVKWLIESQIRQMSGQGPVEGVATGNLDYNSTAPWLVWGPYLWAAEHFNMRSDGLYYERNDYEVDGTHPSAIGEQKIARLMLHFFVNSPYARCWFLANESC